MGEGEPIPTGGPFVPPEPQPAMSQGALSTTQLHAGTTLAACAAMPLGLDGWGGGQVQGTFGSSVGAASGNAPAAAQPHLEQHSDPRLVVTHDVSSQQVGASVEREYTVNGKRK